MLVKDLGDGALSQQEGASLRGGAEGGHSAESEAIPCETEGVDENDSKKQHHLPHSSAMTDVSGIFRLTPNIALSSVKPSNWETVGQEEAMEAMERKCSGLPHLE